MQSIPHMNNINKNDITQQSDQNLNISIGNIKNTQQAMKFNQNNIQNGK